MELDLLTVIDVVPFIGLLSTSFIYSSNKIRSLSRTYVNKINKLTYMCRNKDLVNTELRCEQESKVCLFFWTVISF